MEGREGTGTTTTIVSQYILYYAAKFGGRHHERAGPHKGYKIRNPYHTLFFATGFILVVQKTCVERRMATPPKVDDDANSDDTRPRQQHRKERKKRLAGAASKSLTW